MVDDYLYYSNVKVDDNIKEIKIIMWSKALNAKFQCKNCEKINNFSKKSEKGLVEKF